MSDIYKSSFILFLSFFLITLMSCAGAFAAHPAPDNAATFPRSIDSYNDAESSDVFAILQNRIKQEPFNLIASIIFLCAIIHTFMTSKFLAIAHKWEVEHQEKIAKEDVHKYSVHHWAKLFHFLGEVEVVFGLWVVVLIQAIIIFYDRSTMINYISSDVNFTEPLFVVTVMILAASRPILKLAESIMQFIADMLGGSLAAWWLTILTIGPMLGSLITEPAAITISALLLAAKLYDLHPSEKFKYATIGLLFVNVSVGGTLTHFAAPPVLMVAEVWDWGLIHMLSNFGWKAVLGITISNSLYFFIFRSELKALETEHTIRSLKDKIQRTFMGRTDMKVEFEKIGPLVSQEMNLKENFEKQAEKVLAKIKNRLEKQYLPGIIETGADPALVKEAFDQRF